MPISRPPSSATYSTGRGSGTANRLTLLPLVTPEIVMGVSLFLVFTKLLVVVSLGTGAQLLGLITFEIAFAVIIVLRQKGLIGEELEDLNGLYQRSPAAAVLLLIFMLSLAGIPPTAGFMGKYFIFLSLIESKHPVLAVFAVLYIVPALYYYFRIIVHAWLKQPGEVPRPLMTNAQAVALGVTVFVTLAAGLYPEPFTKLAHYAFGL
jgi:NADH:ubiquinone oxidoreductase subunit 2 (subunit N)